MYLVMIMTLSLSLMLNRYISEENAIAGWILDSWIHCRPFRFLLLPAGKKAVEMNDYSMFDNQLAMDDCL